MQIKTEFKIGKQTNSTWSGIFGHRPEDKLSQHKYGELFAVMSLSAEIDFDASRVGGLLFDQLQAAYFDPEAGEIDILHFERSVVAIKDRVAEILEREPELAKQGLDIELSTAALRGGVLYVAVVGESRIVLIRDEEFAEISGALIDPEADGFLRSGSVVIQPNDRIGLITSHAFGNYTTQTWKKALRAFNLDEVSQDQGAVLLIGNDIRETVVETPAIAPVAELPQSEPELTAEQRDAIAYDTHTEELLQPERDETDLPEKLVPTPAARQQLPKVDRVEEDDEEEFEDVPSWQERLSDSRERLSRGFAGLSATTGNAFAKLKTALVMRREVYEDEEEEYEEDTQEEYSPSARETLSDTRGPVAMSRVSRALGNINYRERSRQAVSLFHRIFISLKAAFLTADEFVSRILNRNQPKTLRSTRRPNVLFWLVVLVICVVVIGIGVNSAVAQNNRNAQIAELEKQIQGYESQFAQLSVRADTAAISNATAADKEKVLSELASFRNSVIELGRDELLTDDQSAKLNTLATNASQKQDAVLAVRSFTQPQVVTDLALYFQSVNTSDLTLSGGEIYIADKGRGVIYRVSGELNSEPGEFASGFSSPYMLATDPDGDIVVVDQNADSVIATVDSESREVRRHPGLSQTRIGTLLAMTIWSNNGAMYNINGVKQSLFRQEEISGNYQLQNDGSPWRLDADFSRASDMYVDGSIYVMIQGKGLTRYFGGEPAQLLLNGLLSSDVSALANATSFELNGTDLFIGDSAGGRVLRFRLNPDGGEAVYQYVEQYVYRGGDNILKSIRDLNFNPQTKKLYILDGAKLLRLDIV